MAPKAKRKEIIKIISALAIPLTVLIVGWLLQKGYQEESIRKDYVQLAVSVLQNSDTTGSRADLRDWAVQLLNENSSVKFSKKVQQQLAAGNISFSNTDAFVSREALRRDLILSKLRPELAELAKRLIQEAKKIGIDVMISKGIMSEQEVSDLYAQGRSKPGQIVTYDKRNAHSEGRAFDVYLIKDGREVDDQHTYNSIGEIAHKLGLKWGGDKTGEFKNNSHFELNVSQP